MFKLTSLVLAVSALGACGDDGGGSNPATPLVGTSTVAFGGTDCGTTAFPRTFVISNSGDEAFDYSIAVSGAEAARYTVSPAAGTVGPGGFALVTVVSAGIPAVSATTDNLYGATATVTTTAAGDAPHEIAITQTARGAILTATATPVAFATTQTVGGAPATQTVTISNAGNADVPVTLTSSSPGFTSGAPTVVPGGGSAQVPLLFTPQTDGRSVATIGASAMGPSCGPSTVAVTASGTGSFAGTAAAVALVGNARLREETQTMCVLLTSGHVACLGSDEMGVRGRGLDAGAAPQRATLVRTLDGALDQVAELAGLGAQVCARRTNGDVFCWGNVGAAQIDTGGTGVPYASQVDAGAAAFAVGYKRQCTISGAGGALQCAGITPPSWDGVDSSTWNVSGATAVALHGGGGYALLADKTVLSFGVATHGLRGNADASNSPPSAVTGLTDVVQIVAGLARGNGGTNAFGNACAVKMDGTVWCWGAGRHGRNGDGTETERAAPVQVLTAADAPLSGVTALAAGRAHWCAITGGAVNCWGRGDRGQLGFSTGSINTFASAMNPAPTDVFTQISAAGRGTCAVTSTHRVLCWGETPASTSATPIAVGPFEPST